MPVFALIVAMLLVRSVGWALLAPVSRVWRVVLSVIAAFVLPVLLAVVVMTGMPLVVLVASASPIVLVTVAAVTGRRQPRQAAI